MSIIRVSLCVLIFNLLSMNAMQAYAAITNPTPQRSYVSLTGSDANNCGAAAPCRSWQAALAQTQDGGEVLTLDSGGFGLLNITQAVTIIVPNGVYGGMSPAGASDGVVINAPGKVVNLQGLTIKAQPGNTASGINIISAAGVSIENCNVSKFTVGNGVHVASAGKIAITDSQFSENLNGAWIDSNGAVLINHSKFYSNSNAGIEIAPSVTSTSAAADIIDTVLSGNSVGIDAFTGLAASTTVIFNATQVVANDNSAGVMVDGVSAVGFISHSVAMGNPFADFYILNGGALNSAADNIAGIINGTVTNASASLKH